MGMFDDLPQDTEDSILVTADQFANAQETCAPKAKTQTAVNMRDYIYQANMNNQTSENNDDDLSLDQVKFGEPSDDM